MTMTEKERNELIAAMRNQTQLGRLNQSEIAEAFDKLAGLGYNIVKVVEPKPEPVTAEPAPKPAPKAPAKHK